MRRTLVVSILVALFSINIEAACAVKSSPSFDRIASASIFDVFDRDHPDRSRELPVFTRIIRYLKKIVRSQEDQMSIPKP